MGIPGIEEQASVDDVVIIYRNQPRLHIQAKKNQTHHKSWSISDLKDELVKAHEQLIFSPGVLVRFVSRSSFGDIQILSEECIRHPDLHTFKKQAPSKQQQLLTKLSGLLRIDAASAFETARHLRFMVTGDQSSLDSRNRNDLNTITAKPDIAVSLLESMLNRHQAKLPDSITLITREDIIKKFSEAGLVITPIRTEQEILDNFART
ncbi:hypothetical protein BOW53_08480 [Solemya pervernicosa gill symbiont]|uniref:CD-NTase associated protein 4-like DNA endonuclease domain-containing protein n=1 Tax=Solemya pervernicosa gill symbiont TaxID=642797 RepID=A0A1T2L5D0_9GAMM|nr:hypothetical protein [Solemya pervernicosa gill symbiont]OOZ40272.1 hypothetical protein BOW53_08480 [Solemya pervernicosa gill symbiont]